MTPNPQLLTQGEFMTLCNMALDRGHSNTLAFALADKFDLRLESAKKMLNGVNNPPPAIVDELLAMAELNHKANRKALTAIKERLGQL